MKRLRGRRIALPDHRSLDVLAALLDEEGATAARYPLVSRDEPDPSHLETGLATLVLGGFECLVFQTREGVARTVSAAEQAGFRADVLGALGRVAKLVRCPEAASGLHALDLAPDARAPSRSPAGLIEALAARSLSGKLVGVEITGGMDDLPVLEYLHEAGAYVFPLLPRRPAPVDERAVSVLVEEVCGGHVDAAVFTAATQLERLFAVARRQGRATSLRAALARIHVAAVGPIVLACLRRRRVHVSSAASRPHFAAPLAEALASCLGPGR